MESVTLRRHSLLLIVPLFLLVIQFVVSPSVLASDEDTGAAATSDTPGFSLPQVDPEAIPHPSLPDLRVPSINPASFPRPELPEILPSSAAAVEMPRVDAKPPADGGPHSIPQVKWPDVQSPSVSVPQLGHLDWSGHFNFPKGLDPGIVAQPDVPERLDPGIEGLPYFPKELDPDYMGLAGQIVDGLLNGQVTWEQYGQLMEENPDIKDKVAPWVEFLIGLKPDGTAYVRDVAIGAALMAIPMGKLAQLGKVPSSALLNRVGGRWVFERLGVAAASGVGKVAASTQDHHLLPKQFAKPFEAAGIDIEKFLVSLPTEVHKSITFDKSRWGTVWNKRWEQFFAEHPDPSQEQVMQQLYTMIRDFELLPYIDQKLFSRITSAMGGTALRELLTQVAGRIGVPSLPSLLPGQLP